MQMLMPPPQGMQLSLLSDTGQSSRTETQPDIKEWKSRQSKQFTLFLLDNPQHIGKPAAELSEEYAAWIERD